MTSQQPTCFQSRCVHYYMLHKRPDCQHRGFTPACAQTHQYTQRTLQALKEDVSEMKKREAQNEKLM